MSPHLFLVLIADAITIDILIKAVVDAVTIQVADKSEINIGQSLGAAMDLAFGLQVDLAGTDPAIENRAIIQVNLTVCKEITCQRGQAMQADISIGIDRKSTRLNSSHVRISYAVFCL